MTYLYHKWFFFLDKEDEINLSDNPYTYFKTYFEESLSVNISKRYDMNDENGIYYHDVISMDSIKEYHKLNHLDKPMFTVKHFKNTVILESFDNQILKSTTIFNFDDNKKQLSSIVLNEDKKLEEYREVFYENHRELREKIVFKTDYNWQVHEEDLTD